MEKAAPALLEPIMKMEVIAPSEFLGDVLGDLNSRRAQILSMENEGDTQVVQAYVPLADTFQYATKLRSLSTGRAIFTMQLDHYDQVPKHIADQVAGSNAKSS
jgi:elongation factor G